jgi:hypothetical protein
MIIPKMGWIFKLYSDSIEQGGIVAKPEELSEWMVEMFNSFFMRFIARVVEMGDCVPHC